MAWSAPRTWVVGELVTAAFMNQEIRDNIEYIADTMELYVQCAKPSANEGILGIVSVIQTRLLNDPAWVTFRIPDNFDTLLAAKFIVIPKMTSAAANWDIAFYNASEGEAYNTHTDLDNATTYNVVNLQYYGVDFTPIMTTIAAGDICGAQIILGDATHDFDAVGFYMKYSIG